MSDDDLRRLSSEQLDERLDEAFSRLEEVQTSHKAVNRNLSENPGGGMPQVPMAQLARQDDEYQSAIAEVEAIEQEIRRRRS